jgi:hypothetical protein
MPIPQDALLERSKEASKTSNEHSRVNAQSSILINGGAATAVIAYLSKDKLDPAMAADVWVSLCGYGFGVIAATLMIFCATQAMDHYYQYWLARVEDRSTEGHLRIGHKWWKGYLAGSIITVACFAGASFYFGYLLAKTPVPQIAATYCLPG